jgi:hypothetical protein
MGPSPETIARAAHDAVTRRTRVRSKLPADFRPEADDTFRRRLTDLDPESRPSATPASDSDPAEPEAEPADPR